MTVLPRSRICRSAERSLALSLWWRPMEGSYRMYMTPTSLEPIWLASRMRWLSPPERVPEFRASDR
jgi:hypothetical protein